MLAPAMDPLTLRRQFRLGVLIAAMAGMVGSLALTGPLDAGDWPWWLALGVLAATGIGLMARVRFARVIAGVIMALGVIGSTWSLLDSLHFFTLDVTWLWPEANAVATTALMVWSCLRAIAVLRGRASTSAVTVRLVGATLVCVAANHLWVASLVGMSTDGSWSISISPRGTQLIGFPAWPIWHAATLVPGMLMLAGPRRWFGVAATILVGLLAALIPLDVVAAISLGVFGIDVVIFGIAMVLIPVYLAWWLRDELVRTT